MEKIPKIIHYIWIGNKKKPKIFRKCYKSWKRHLVDYKIMEWNESNLPLNLNKYVSDAIVNKKYAFASDVFRWYILYNYGGIYLDIDVEILKPLDIFLEHELFTGLEKENIIAPGLIFGAVKGNSFIKSLLEDYNRRSFIINNKMNLTTICTYTTNKYLEYVSKGNEVDFLKVYPERYFQPMNLETRKITVTNETYTIHHYQASWHNRPEKIKNFLSRKLIKYLGKDRYFKLLNFIKRVKK